VTPYTQTIGTSKHAAARAPRTPISLCLRLAAVAFSAAALWCPAPLALPPANGIATM